MSDEEKVVSWLEENYKGLVAGILIGLSILYGYKAYISNENTNQLNLSRQYDLAINEYNSGKTDEVLKFSRNNITQNPENMIDRPPIVTVMDMLIMVKHLYLTLLEKRM